MYVSMSIRWRIGISVCFGSFVCFLCFTRHITNLRICNTHTNAKHTRKDTRTRTRTPSMHKFDKRRNLVCADSRLMQEVATQIPTFRAGHTSPRRSYFGRGMAGAGCFGASLLTKLRGTYTRHALLLCVVLSVPRPSVAGKAKQGVQMERFDPDYIRFSHSKIYDRFSCGRYVLVC